MATGPDAVAGAARSGGEDPQAPRVWLITGASRGIGRALVDRLLRRGDAIVAGYREVGPVAPKRGFVPVRLDVTDPGDCAAAVATAVDTFGRLDVVANVAGVGLVGAIEETTAEQARALFEVNFWGVANVLAAALPVLRGQRAGHVVQVSSLSGRIAAPGVGYYAASKFALEGLSESLHAELAPLGVNLTIVEPGGVRTDWAGSSLWSAPVELDDYDETAGATRRLLAAVDGGQPTLPEEVAAAIVDLVEAPAPPRRAAVTPDAVERIASYLDHERSLLTPSRKP
ncbi:MAG: SDR family NAD(P)-dependent oxidoreductase [Actinobacteria bacterium]|nr:SDR family NAD(P)-dependent oxidoreductase [Actinomycetota bacterium]